MARRAFIGNIRGPEGQKGKDAGFGDITAQIDANVGTPLVEVKLSGPNTARSIFFNFKNLKGEKGEMADYDDAEFMGENELEAFWRDIEKQDNEAKSKIDALIKENNT